MKVTWNSGVRSEGNCCRFITEVALRFWKQVPQLVSEVLSEKRRKTITKNVTQEF